jgi:putative FmdB family regulatory protein
MPLYDYQCTNAACRHKQEESRAVDDRHRKTVCEKCGSSSEKTVSRTGVPRFSGSGFYVNDYKGKR